MVSRRRSDSKFDFFGKFIPAHTLDFSKDHEVKARYEITSQFLETYPIKDIGFEYIVYPENLSNAKIRLQLQQKSWMEEQLQLYDAKIHYSLHFPSTPDSSLFLGSYDPEVIKKIEKTFSSCLDLAIKGNIRTIVIHSGGNITPAQWKNLRDNFRKKQEAISRIAKNIINLLGMMRDIGYKGTLAWENMPYPFDIPAFTYTNIIPDDFNQVFSKINQENVPNIDQLGICHDLCHSWIVKKTALYFYKIYKETGEKLTPPGVFAEEWENFIAQTRMNNFIEQLNGKIVHTHLAESKGDYTGVSKPTEGDELGTGELSTSQEVVELFAKIHEQYPYDKKIIVNLEIKDKDFTNPKKTARSLMFLGEKFFKN